jgi:hypothetical protein
MKDPGFPYRLAILKIMCYYQTMMQKNKINMLLSGDEQ